MRSLDIVLAPILPLVASVLGRTTTSSSSGERPGASPGASDGSVEAASTSNTSWFTSSSTTTTKTQTTSSSVVAEYTTKSTSFTTSNDAAPVSSSSPTDLTSRRTTSSDPVYSNTSSHLLITSTVSSSIPAASIPLEYVAAEECNSKSLLWKSRQVVTSTFIGLTSGLQWLPTILGEPGVKPYTTLCDGIPRAKGNMTSTMVYPSTNTWSTTKVVTSTVSNGESPPACTINEQDCLYLYNSYTLALNDAYDSSRPLPTSPVCTKYASCTNHVSGPNSDSWGCYISGFNVEIAYWQTPVSGLCETRRTITNPAQGPQTATIWGTTVTSPAVLVSFDRLYALNGCDTVGTEVRGLILSQNPDQISTQCGLLPRGSGLPVNFGDWQAPIPHSVYQCQPDCGIGVPSPFWSFATNGPTTGGLCSTIWEDHFSPNIAIPTDVLKLQPAWGNCEAQPLGNVLRDPPIALQIVPHLAAPTTPADNPLASTTPTQQLGSAPTSTMSQQAVQQTQVTVSIPSSSIAQATTVSQSNHRIPQDELFSEFSPTSITSLSSEPSPAFAPVTKTTEIGPSGSQIVDIFGTSLADPQSPVTPQAGDLIAAGIGMSTLAVSSPSSSGGVALSLVGSKGDIAIGSLATLSVGAVSTISGVPLSVVANGVLLVGDRTTITVLPHSQTSQFFAPISASLTKQGANASASVADPPIPTASSPRSDDGDGSTTGDLPGNSRPASTAMIPPSQIEQTSSAVDHTNTAAVKCSARSVSWVGAVCLAFIILLGT